MLALICSTKTSENAQKMKLLSFAIVLGMLLTSCTPVNNKKPKPRRFSDVTLVGYWHREPHMWDAARFAPHVSCKAPDG